MLFDSKARGLLQSIIEVLNHNYPEQMAGMFIINAPAAFSMVWRVIRNFVDPITRTKIRILGSNFLPELTKVIHPQDVPDFLGGDCRCPGGCLSRQAGPWDAEGLPGHLDLGRMLRGEEDQVAGTAPEEEASEPKWEDEQLEEDEEEGGLTNLQQISRLKCRTIAGGALQVRHRRRHRGWKSIERDTLCVSTNRDDKSIRRATVRKMSHIWDSIHSK